MKLKRILAYILTIMLLTCEGVILFWMGTKAIQPLIKITSSNYYLFYSSIFNNIASSFLLSLILCSLYFFAIIIFRPKLFFVKIIFTLLSCILMLFVLSAFAGPGGGIDLYILMNFFVVFSMSLSIPFLEERLLKGLNIKN